MSYLIRHPTGMMLCATIIIVIAYFCALSKGSENNTLEKDTFGNACGEWVSKYYRSSFVLFKFEGAYYFGMERIRQGKLRKEIYSIENRKGIYVVDIGFLMILSYDKNNDILFLSKGGEHKRIEN